MTYKITITKEALSEIAETVEYIERFNPLKALEVAEELKSYFKKTLSLFPRSGIVYDDQIRKLTHKKHTAFYFIDEDNQEIFILHILDLTKPLEARDIEL